MWRITTVIIFAFIICNLNGEIGPQPPAKPANVNTEVKSNNDNASQPNAYFDVDAIMNKTIISSIPASVKVTDKQPPRNQTQQHVAIVEDEMNRTLSEPALYRLFYVLLVLSTVTVCYVAYRMYRVRNGGQRLTTVRKYGILTQRSDIEMEPLHLDDDEEDDTVFEVTAHANR